MRTKCPRGHLRRPRGRSGRGFGVYTGHPQTGAVLHVRHRRRDRGSRCGSRPDRRPEAARIPRLRLGRHRRGRGRRACAACAAPAASRKWKPPRWPKDFHAELGIGHTRWATHGGVTEANAHPHISHGELALVHNGIIENHEEQRERLQRAGLRVRIADRHRGHRPPDPPPPVARATTCSPPCSAAVKELDGAYALAVISKQEPERMVCARMGCPLLVGLGEGENFIASDVSAILQATRQVIFLEEGDTAEVTPRQRARVRRGRRRSRARRAPVRRVAGLAGAGPVPPLHAEGDPRAAARDRRHHRGDDRRQGFSVRSCSVPTPRRCCAMSKACRSSPAAPATTPA